MGVQAWTPFGGTQTFTAAVTAPPAVQAIGTTLGPNQYRIINAGSTLVFLGVAVSAAAAETNASAVVSSIPLLPGTDEILTFAPNAWFSGTTAAGTAVIYITPGDGL